MISKELFEASAWMLTLAKKAESLERENDRLRSAIGHFEVAAEELARLKRSWIVLVDDGSGSNRDQPAS